MSSENQTIKTAEFDIDAEFENFQTQRKEEKEETTTDDLLNRISQVSKNFDLGDFIQRSNSDLDSNSIFKIDMENLEKMILAIVKKELKKKGL